MLSTVVPPIRYQCSIRGWSLLMMWKIHHGLFHNILLIFSYWLCCRQVISAYSDKCKLQSKIHIYEYRIFSFCCHLELPVCKVASIIQRLHFSHKMTHMCNLCCFMNSPCKKVYKQGDHSRPPNTTGVALLLWLLDECWPWRRHDQENVQRCKEQRDCQLQVRVEPLYVAAINQRSSWEKSR